MKDLKASNQDLVQQVKEVRFARLGIYSCLLAGAYLIFTASRNASSLVSVSSLQSVLSITRKGTRSTLANHFNHIARWTSAAETFLLVSDKNILASLCYGFRDGPHWGNLLRIGYDPRKTPDSYQCVFSLTSSRRRRILISL